MKIARPALTARLHSMIEETPSRVPVLLGGCGTGRTTVLQVAVHLVIFAVYLFTTVVP